MDEENRWVFIYILIVNICRQLGKAPMADMVENVKDDEDMQKNLDRLIEYLKTGKIPKEEEKKG